MQQENKIQQVTNLIVFLMTFLGLIIKFLGLNKRQNVRGPSLANVGTGQQVID